MAPSEALDLPIEVMPGNRLLALLCPGPAHSSRLCFAHVELGERGPDSVAGDEDIVYMDLHRACQAPSLGISLALRRCAFPVNDDGGLGFGPVGGAGRQADSACPSPCWVGGFWRQGPSRPTATILRKTADADTVFGTGAAPLMLGNDDLTWWLDPHLVDRMELLRRLSRR
ncbi:hypothetical protein [Salinicola acroporae]|uniref:Uncharacterized protein n=1 Tax=Salinicola acroporae TaxID=1541440 RepID=A0ABT6I2T1_9GAMM|nr:hypothetical protein [Salinicola acroporae]MDH4571812.1 hypothetical protein [Salinicola acroporae]